MSDLQARINALHKAGFSAAEIDAWSAERRSALAAAGFTGAEIDAAFGVKPPHTQPTRSFWDDALAVFRGHADGALAAIDEAGDAVESAAGDVVSRPAGEPGLVELFETGFEGSVSGLMARGRLPDKPLPDDLSLLGGAAAQFGTLAGDFPFFVLGAVPGLGSGPAAPLVSAGGAFALPAMLREGLMREYRDGTATSWSEYWSRVVAIGVETLRGAATGVTTAAAGGLAKPGLQRLGSEIATLVTVGEGLRGHVPEPRDFVDAAIVLGGLKAATGTAGKLRDLYARTGVKPEQVARDAETDPTIAEDIASTNIKTPRAYQRPQEPRTEASVPGGAEVAEGGRVANGAPRQPSAPPPSSGSPAVNAVLDRIEVGGKGEGRRYGFDDLYTDAVNDMHPLSLAFREMNRRPASETAPSSGTASAPKGEPGKDVAIVAEKGSDVVPSPTRPGAGELVAAGEKGALSLSDPLPPKPTPPPSAEIASRAEADFVTVARLYRGAMGKPEHFLELSPFKFDTFENVGKSLKAIVEPVAKAGDLDNLRAYLVARRALELKGRGIKTGVPDDAAKSTVKELARLKSVAADLDAYQTHVLDYLRDSGVISARQYERYRDLNRQYVPFYRAAVEGGTRGGVNKGMQASDPTKAIKGSERLIIDPLESIIKNTYALVMAAEQNYAARTFVDFALEHGGSKWAELIDPKWRPIRLTDDELRAILRKAAKAGGGATTTTARRTTRTTKTTSTTGATAGEPGAEAAGVAKVRARAHEALVARGFSEGEAKQILDRIASSRAADSKAAVEKAVSETTTTVESVVSTIEGGELVPPELVNIFRPVQRLAGKDEIVVIRDGQYKLYRVPPEIAEIYKGLNREMTPTLLKVLSFPAKLLRAGAVLSPEFIGRNPFRDQLSAFVQSENLYLPFVGLAQGLFSLARKDRDFGDWLKGGGSLATLVSVDRPETQRTLRQIAGETNFMEAARNVVTSPIAALQVLSMASEQGTRLGVFKANLPPEARGHGPRTKAGIQKAALQAREATLDFRRIGAKTQAMNMLTAFFNAAVQGTDKEIRSFKDRPLQTTARVAAAITIPSVLLYLHNRDDPEYRNIPQWQRDLFWIVPAGGTYWRIPKPFGLGVVFGTGAERVTEYILDRDPKAFDDLLETVVRGAAPSLVPTAAVPVIEQFANRSLFLDRPIIPRDRENLLPEFQYRPYTTEIAKLMGSLVARLPGGRFSEAASPATIENYVRAWSGGLGVHMLNLADYGLRKAGVLPDPVLPAKTLADIPFVKGFVVREPTAGAEPISDFFDRFERQAREIATVRFLAREGDAAAALKQLKLSGGVFADVDGVRQALTNMTKVVRDVTKNPEMSADDKRRIIDAVYRQMIPVAEAGNAILDAREKLLTEKDPD